MTLCLIKNQKQHSMGSIKPFIALSIFLSLAIQSTPNFDFIGNVNIIIIVTVARVFHQFLLWNSWTYQDIWSLLLEIHQG